MFRSMFGKACRLVLAVWRIRLVQGHGHKAFPGRPVPGFFKGQHHVIRVHYTVDETYMLPPGNQVCLPLDHFLKEPEIGVFPCFDAREMALDGIIGQGLKFIGGAKSRGEFKGAHTEMAGCHPR